MIDERRIGDLCPRLAGKIHAAFVQARDKGGPAEDAGSHRAPEELLYEVVIRQSLHLLRSPKQKEGGSKNKGKLR
jgi:hypothetical protein